MKKILIAVVGIILMSTVSAQIKDPVSWSFSATKADGNNYELHITATIDKGWHIYSQTTPDGGPVATKIDFVKSPLVTLIGKTKETGKLEQKHEELFGLDVKQFSNRVDFVQLIQLKAKVKTNITGTIKFMSCNDSECLPPKTQKFSIPLN